MGRELCGRFVNLDHMVVIFPVSVGGEAHGGDESTEEGEEE
jgi:hypothetical protein